jgi:hypothetical protein
MGSMQCNVEFGYQLSVCSGTKENHGKLSGWPVAGPLFFFFQESNVFLMIFPLLKCFICDAKF